MTVVEIDTLFLEAVDDGNLEAMKFLLKKGADIHTNEDKALTIACRNSNCNIATYLLENGIDEFAHEHHEDIHYFIYLLLLRQKRPIRHHRPQTHNAKWSFLQTST